MRRLLPVSLLNILLAILLSACATKPVVQVPQQLFDDGAFAPPRQQLGAEQIFAVTPAMRSYAQRIAARKGGVETRRALFDALYRRDGLQLEYEATTTRTAAEAFEARHGNCLSLVIMTTALAEEMDVPVVLQTVASESSWSRSGSLYFNSGHVNLALGRLSRRDRGWYGPDDYLLIDFMPPVEGKEARAVPIDKATVVAMFMNNRAAEALTQGDIDEAYWWSRNAITAAPALPHPYNTLAIVYQRHGNPALAETALRHVLRSDPDNTVTLANLAQLLGESGRPAEAAAVKARLAQLQPYPPFYFLELGQKAMLAGDYAAARRLFERELARDPDYHETHRALAAAAFELGDLKAAQAHLQRALAGSSTAVQQGLYTAKLDRLRAYGEAVTRR